MKNLSHEMESAMDALDVWVKQHCVKPVEMVLFGNQAFLKEPLVMKNQEEMNESLKLLETAGVERGMDAGWLSEETFDEGQWETFGLSLGELRYETLDLPWLVAWVVDRHYMLEMTVLSMDTEAMNYGFVCEETLQEAKSLLEEMNEPLDQLKARVQDKVVNEEVFELLLEEGA